MSKQRSAIDEKTYIRYCPSAGISFWECRLMMMSRKLRLLPPNSVVNFFLGVKVVGNFEALYRNIHRAESVFNVGGEYERMREKDHFFKFAREHFR